ncbi:MAG: EamA family transporter [Galbibacter orientalis]|uniref:EamA family transporter n=1 Tax=Galbibacter orientalis TaxID=453852 RepID=UPI0030016963
MKAASNKVLIVLAFIAIYVIWGSTYFLNKIAVTELPPFMLAGLRFVTAGIIAFIIAKSIGLDIKVSKKQFINTSIAGFLFLAIGNGFVVWALKYVDSGFAALEMSAQPLIVLLLLRILEGKKIKFMSFIGVGLGILGIYLLVSQNTVSNKENSIVGIGVIFLCMISWAYASIFVSKAKLPKHFFVNSAYQMFMGGIFLLTLSLTLGEQWTAPNTWQTDTQLALLALILLGSIVAFTSFNYLLRVVSPEKVATSTYVNPIIALFLGWFFLEEHITLQSIIAAAILLTGVYFINTKKTLLIFSRFSSKIGKKYREEM